MDMDHVKAATVLIINPEGFVLGVSRKDDHTAFGLPGGKRESRDSDPIATAIRETDEETGVKLLRENMRLVYVDMARTMVCACYLAMAYDDSGMHTSEEGVVEWVAYETLLQGPFQNYNRNLLRKVFLHLLRGPHVF